MPEYLAPGVYIEEVSYRAKTIEGVSTSTAGFVGAARYGPVAGEPELLTSLADYERIYGGLEPLVYGTTAMTNYLAHAVRAFFENGGTRLYVARVYRPTGTGDYPGHAQWPETAGDVALRARYPGAAGNMLVTFTFRVGPNILATDADGNPVLRGATNYDLVWVADIEAPISPPPGAGTLYWLEPYFDATTRRNTFRLRRNDADDADTSDALYLASPGVGDVRVVTVNVTASPPGQDGREQTWENLSFHPDHRQALTRVFAAEPRSRNTALYVPLVFEPSTALGNGVTIVQALLDEVAISPPVDPLNPATSDADRTYQALLAGGDDGERPEAGDFEGQGDDDPREKSGLKAFENIADISIVAAPGSTYGYNNSYQPQAQQITNLLISHCERMRYRIAVLDSADGQAISEVRQYRGQVDSKHAALYYPWVMSLDPLTGEEINLPPSGFVAGIYARNDVEKGVHKAPANEVVRLAIGFEALLNKAQQDVLNPEGINCFRFFDGRGYRLWGARTISSDPEWKYVNLRRYFAYLERSIELGTQWVVFENNDHRLWANVRRTVEDFLFNEWKSGRLFGEKPEEAYFVRCDRSTMTQNDLDNGRLICLVGVAPVRPAEFVIFRIGQWTADRRS
ncbi:MAG: phage tail sheath subtilisin-like domain-containing protein [Chloroflexi bacterium]|nr:phage tail sheath subtilisin-like domain-containing protein [Chloroflexota bacterium]MCI0647793.1 phage tail sheath subtilisin-like domain-containing protein [Chloroflexota bacterium]MCI0729005.1 phage tail sheath subtilisin-like domain-containing protein [Chloroflexota bacterium]